MRLSNHYLKLIDILSLGENLQRDDEYRVLYQKLMPQLDIVLWVLKADFFDGRTFLSGIVHAQ